MIMRMTTAAQPLPTPEPSVIAQRLRQYLGDKKISRNKLAMATGIGRTTLSARLDGVGEFGISEVLVIAWALNRSWLWVLTGDDSNDPPPPGFGLPETHNGPRPGLLLPRVDSNHEPAGEEFTPDLPAVNAA